MIIKCKYRWIAQLIRTVTNTIFDTKIWANVLTKQRKHKLHVWLIRTLRKYVLQTRLKAWIIKKYHFVLDASVFWVIYYTWYYVSGKIWPIPRADFYKIAAKTFFSRSLWQVTADSVAKVGGPRLYHARNVMVPIDIVHVSIDSVWNKHTTTMHCHQISPPVSAYSPLEADFWYPQEY